LRDKREKQFLPTDTPEQRYAKFDAIPTYERELEKYINPYKDGWQTRYYRCLLKMEDDDEERKKQISLNYLEGLEWTMKYYTSGCPNWRWCYKHHYPPLLQDLVKYIPYFETEFIKDKPADPVSQLVQLCYVLPRKSLSFVPELLYKTLITDHDEWYPTDCEFVWAYSKYFWESHVDLPDIDIDYLDKTIIECIK
jgi:5'-3' exoribonuclease 2